MGILAQLARKPIFAWKKANIGGNLDLTDVVGIIDLKGAFIRGSVNLTNVILISANLEGARFGQIIYDHKSTTFLDSKTGKTCFPVVNKDDRGEYFEFV